MSTTAPWDQPNPVEPVRSPNVAPFNSPIHDSLCRLGLWFGVLSGALVLFAAFGSRVVAEQGFASVAFTKAAMVGSGVAVAVVFLLTVFLPFAWARFAGIGLLALVAFIYGVVITVARSDETYLVPSPPDVKLGPAGVMLFLAFGAACVGLALALIGTPRVGRPPTLDSVGQPIRATSGYAVASLVLSLCSFLVLFSAPLGVAFGVAAIDDIKQSGGHRTGRGMAIAGQIVGLFFVAMGVFFMALLAGSTDPGINH